MTGRAAYDATHRYDGAVLQHGERDGEPVAMILQDRDVEVLFDVWRYRFMASDQLRELHFRGARAWPAQRRLAMLFAAGYLERLRPYPQRREGSYPWTYYLGAAGHDVLQRVGLVERRARYRQARIFDFGRVAHDVEVNGWVLALRRAVGESVHAWRGERESAVMPSALARQGQLRLLERWTPAGLRAGARPIRPDAVLEVVLPSGKGGRLYVEHDRTERPDKNYDKLLRYDSFLTWWGGESAAGENAYAVFVCQTESALAEFVAAADAQLTGHLAHPGAKAAEHIYVGRQRTLLVLERDAYEGRLNAFRVPGVSARSSVAPGHRRRGRRAPDRGVRDRARRSLGRPAARRQPARPLFARPGPRPDIGAAVARRRRRGRRRRAVLAVPPPSSGRGYPGPGLIRGPRLASEHRARMYETLAHRPERASGTCVSTSRWRRAAGAGRPDATARTPPATSHEVEADRSYGR